MTGPSSRSYAQTRWSKERVAAQIEALKTAGQHRGDTAYDGPVPDEDWPDRYLDRHRADVEERYEDRRWGGAA